MLIREHERKKRSSADVGNIISLVIIPHSVSWSYLMLPEEEWKRKRCKERELLNETYDCAFVSVECQRHYFHFGNERVSNPRSRDRD